MDAQNQPAQDGQLFDLLQFFFVGQASKEVYTVHLTKCLEKSIKIVEDKYRNMLEESEIRLQVKHDFATYKAIRQTHGHRHLNQAFDTRYVEFGADDFWLLAENQAREPIATYCLRRFVVDDFYDLIRSLTLWFSLRPQPADPRFVVQCRIPSFGGEIAHGGGLWIRDDYRGASRLAVVMPRFARAVALLRRPFDHDSAMIRDEPDDRPDAAERKATYMGSRVYGFARVRRIIDGWFPPEGREAIIHLCHATRAEAIASLFDPPVANGGLRLAEFGKRPLVDQHNQPIHTPAILSKRQEQASV
ncbi:MAG TPA: hypothetical protein VMS01_06265 [Stellaceae bacterium]|nr:hypothetical protein [Stellaceae bacterium]